MAPANSLRFKPSRKSDWSNKSDETVASAFSIFAKRDWLVPEARGRLHLGQVQLLALVLQQPAQGAAQLDVFDVGFRKIQEFFDRAFHPSVFQLIHDLLAW